VEQENRHCRTRREGKKKGIQLAIAPPNNRVIEDNSTVGWTTWPTGIKKKSIEAAP
jgi:hypothetical protein